MGLMINGGEFEALIHSRNGGFKHLNYIPFMLLWFAILEPTFFWFLYSFEANCQVEVMMGNVEKLGAISEDCICASVYHCGGRCIVLRS